MHYTLLSPGLERPRLLVSDIAQISREFSRDHPNMAKLDTALAELAILSGEPLHSPGMMGGAAAICTVLYPEGGLGFGVFCPVSSVESKQCGE